MTVATKKKRVPPAKFMRPLQPSAALAALVGAEPLPRTEITKKLWEYIKAADLQNPLKRRQIICDAKFSAFAEGKSSIDMFEMTKLISKHVTEVGA